MKIVFVVNNFPALSESFVVRQIVDVLECGHEVSIFAFADSFEKAVHEEVRQYSLLDKTHYILLPKKKWLRRLKGLLQLFICLVLSAPATFRLIRAFLVEKRFSYPQLFMYRLLMKEKADIVHAHFGPSGLRSLCLKKAGLNVKLLTTFHGYDVSVYVKQHGRTVYQPLFDQGDMFTYNSEATKLNLLRLGCPEDKMVKVPMGIKLDRISFRERRYEAGKTIHILSVGRLVEMKGREYAIKAVANLKNKYPIQYDILGDGPLRDDLQQLIEDLEASEVVHLWGWVNSEMLKKMYEQAHIFLHPSVTAADGNQEGQGVVLLEAQAYGIPVVATRHGAFPDSVQNGQTAYLVPEKDIASLEAVLEKMIQNGDKWPEMGRKGRAFVESNFDARRLNDRLIDTYKHLLQSH